MPTRVGYIEPMTNNTNTTTRPKTRTLLANNGATVKTSKKQRWVAVQAKTNEDGNVAYAIAGSDSTAGLAKRLMTLKGYGMDLNTITIYDMETGEIATGII